MAQYSLIIFDEATLFDFDEMILPLMGRLRNANVSYEPKMMWATNPMYGHGILEWIRDFYLDEEGIPIPERSNVERYFVIENGKPVWFDKREDAEAIYGKGKDKGILSFRAIRAHVTQNIPLLKADPSYISKLKALSPIKQRIFLDGSWFAREEEAGLFRRNMVTMVKHPSVTARKRVIAFDQASTPVSTQVPAPDWTRGVVMSKDDKGIYTIEDLVSCRDRPMVVEQLIYDTARRYPGATVVISIDPGSSGVAYSNSIKKNLAEMGIACKQVRPQKAKRTRFLPFSAIAEAGYVQVVEADWNEEMFNELEEFTGLNKNEWDDICDAISDAVLVLNQTLELPSMSLGHINISTGKQQPKFDFNRIGSTPSFSIPTFNISG